MEDLKQFEGTFYSEELETGYDIVLQDSLLVARHLRLDDIPLELKSRDRFTGNKWFFDILEFARNDKGTVNEVFISGRRGRVKSLRFRKIY